jgi:hypothetical protein
LVDHLEAVTEFSAERAESESGRRERERAFMTHWNRMRGMLTQLAAETARKGTKRPTTGGAAFANRFKESAVASAPPVATEYAVASWLRKREGLEDGGGGQRAHERGSGVSPLRFV